MKNIRFNLSTYCRNVFQKLFLLNPLSLVKNGVITSDIKKNKKIERFTKDVFILIIMINLY